MKTLVIASLISAACLLYIAFSPTEVNYDDAFEQFISTYGRSYSSQTELQYRKMIFEENMRQAEKLQKLNPDAEFGATPFADLSDEEMKLRMGYVEIDNDQSDLDLFTETSDSLNSIDYRGNMKSIQDQGRCGSCWAFSATATFEGRYSLFRKANSKLSEQQALDCSGPNHSCNGGHFTAAWVYMRTHKFCTLSSYKYTGIKGQCKTKCSPTISDKGYTKVKNNESSMHKALQQGPISIAVDATTWKTYRGGVMTASQCGKKPNHAVVLVGYEPQENAWIIRNSWGSRFGENGHIRLKYGTNTCAITHDSAFPKI
ncbi:unnamed protein product [Moneuplotes crassus]|uniref:Uncharacterized protein n=1 Tax=Euplotes crassus TaxID=5936 RepID=A0AAD2D133_EUPCR|nr:unnamed protein product [Moneuplotes crassus]